MRTCVLIGIDGRIGGKTAIIEAAMVRQMREMGFSDSDIDAERQRMREGKVVILRTPRDRMQPPRVE